MKRNNGIAKALSLIATCFLVIGTIGSIIAAGVAENGLVALYGIISSLVIYVLFSGFAEIIELLHNILATQKNMIKKFDILTNVDKQDNGSSSLKNIEENLPAL